MTRLLLALFTLLTLGISSCSFYRDGLADYDWDGTVSQQEYDRYNRELDEKQHKITQESAERRDLIMAERD